MKASKAVSLILSLILVITAMGTMSAFAVAECRTSIFETDFSSETVGAATTLMTKTSGSDATVKNDNDSYGNYVSMSKGNRIWRKFGGVSTGFAIEFDVKGNYGFAIGIAYDTDSALSGKWPFELGQNGQVNAFTALSGLPGQTNSGGNRTAVKCADGTTNLTYTAGAWQHVKVDFDLIAGTAVYTVAGKKSSPVNIEYIKEKTIGGFGFYLNGDESCVDNVKLYETSSYETNLVNDTYDSIAENGDSAHKSYDSWNIGTGAKPVASVIKKSVALSPNATNAEKIETPIPADPDNNVLKLPNISSNGFAAYTFGKISNTTVTVELDLQAGNGGFAICFNENGSYGTRMPLIYYRNASLFANSDLNLTVGGINTSNAIRYPKSGTTSQITGPTAYVWNHIKFVADLSTGDCRVELNGVGSDAINLPWLKGMTIQGVGFRHVSRNSTVCDQDAFLDNVRISIPSDGDSITAINTGSGRFAMVFKDYIDSATLTKDKVSLTNANGESVEIADVRVSDSGKTAVIETTVPLTSGTEYTVNLADTVAYKDGYKIIETSQKFIYKDVNFAGTVSFDGNLTPADLTADKEITAKYQLTTNVKTTNVDFYVASYAEDGSLIDIAYKARIVGEAEYNSAQDLSLKLTKNAAAVKAFVWSDSLVPFGEFAAVGTVN